MKISEIVIKYHDVRIESTIAEIKEKIKKGEDVGKVCVAGKRLIDGLQIYYACKDLDYSEIEVRNL